MKLDLTKSTTTQKTEPILNTEPTKHNHPKLATSLPRSGVEVFRMAQMKEPARLGGMGAIYTPDNTTFRVWAPNAEQVYVMGSFNDWAEEENSLTHEGDGYWALALPGIKAGAEYRFVICNNKELLAKTDPYARAVHPKSRAGLIVDPAFDWGQEEFSMPAWNELVIYELHIGTFYQKEGSQGTFDTAAEKLGYLQELGINCIKIMPPAEFPGEVSWGYNPSYPFAVEHAYGGPDGLKRLVREAHRHGIAIVIDVVYNHLGPMDMDLWRFDGWHENDGGGIYFYNDWRAETPWGHTRPDYGRPEVRRYLIDNAMMWLEEYRCDGIRVDSVSHILATDGSHNLEKILPDGMLFLHQMNHELHERFPWKITIAEDLTCNEWVTQTLGEGGAGFDSQWDRNFVHPVRQALKHVSDDDRSMAEVAKAITFYYGPSAFSRVIYTESHDEVSDEASGRLVQEIAPEETVGSWFAVKKSMMGVVLAAVSPGIPMIFQGQEFCFDKEFSFQNTAPVDWAMAEREAGLTRMCADTFALRRNADGRSRGLAGHGADVYQVDEVTDLLAMHRFEDGGPGDSVVVVVNMSAKPLTGYRIGLPLAGTWQTLLNTDSSAYHNDFSNVGLPGLQTEEVEHAGQPQSSLVDVGPYSLVVLGF